MQNAEQIVLLNQSVSNTLTATGVDTLDSYNESAKLMLAWVNYLHTTQLTGNANHMLEGVGALIRECAAYSSMGLARAAIFSLRGQIDLLMSWLYFKDHNVELQVVENTGNGYRLVSEVIKYLNDVNSKFGTRIAILKQTTNRKVEDPYRLLSAHVHAQSSFAVPTVQNLSQVVNSKETIDQVIELQRDCADFVSDILLAINLGDWASIPQPAKDAFKKKPLTDKQKVALFA